VRDGTVPILTRRRLLHGLAAIGGLGAAATGLRALGLLGGPAQADGATIEVLPPGSLAGRRVLVIGAGLAGLCSALRLARAGAEVEVLEAAVRAGGRSLTLRHGDRFTEIGWDAPTEMRFEGVGAVPPEHPGNHFNAGPSRIPYHHGRVLDWCRALGVALEPYVFATGANLMQNDAWNGGAPVQLRRLQHDLRGHLAELLAKAGPQQALDDALAPAEVTAFLGMLTQFGQLSTEGAELVYRAAAGYRLAPDGANGAGEPWPTLSLREILASNFWRGGMFDELQYTWQATLLQPAGGMDAIVRGFRAAAVPGGRSLGDLVATGRAVRRLEQADAHLVVTTADGARATADFVVATAAPPLLAQWEGDALQPRARQLLAGLGFMPACKVGWQARSRFWETEDRIYGGISRTGHPIGEIGYPSSGFHGPTGVLTGAYIRGGSAATFQRFSRADRLTIALEGGERLHPGFRDRVFADNGVSVAWARMPFQSGAWSFHSLRSEPALFARLRDGDLVHPRVVLAGDWLSHWPGWQEGALESAHAATDRVAAAAVAGR